MAEPIYVLSVSFHPNEASAVAAAGHDLQALRKQAVQFVVELYGYETERNGDNGWLHPAEIESISSRHLAAVVHEVRPTLYADAIVKAGYRRERRMGISNEPK